MDCILLVLHEVEIHLGMRTHLHHLRVSEAQAGSEGKDALCADEDGVG
jgi:hypothetical protein